MWTPNHFSNSPRNLRVQILTSPVHIPTWFCLQSPKRDLLELLYVSKTTCSRVTEDINILFSVSKTKRMGTLEWLQLHYHSRENGHQWQWEAYSAPHIDKGFLNQLQVLKSLVPVFLWHSLCHPLQQTQSCHSHNIPCFRKLISFYSRMNSSACLLFHMKAYYFVFQRVCTAYVSMGLSLCLVSLWVVISMCTGDCEGQKGHQLSGAWLTVDWRSLKIQELFSTKPVL